VVFYGDSITEQRLYTTFVETFVLTRYPQLNVRFVNSGWGRETVAGGDGGPVGPASDARRGLSQAPVMTGYMFWDERTWHGAGTTLNDEHAFNPYKADMEHIVLKR